MAIWDRMFGGGGAGGAETRALTLRIRELLKAGKNPDEVRKLLIQEGVRPRRAASMVALVVRAEAAARRMFDPEA